MGQRSVSGAELRAECTNLERAVLHARLASETDLVAWRPGGEKNTRKDAKGYLTYYGRLHRFHARGEAKIADEERLRADAAVLSALRDEPIRVDLLTPYDRETVRNEPAAGENGDITTPLESAEPASSSLIVYPKSLDALLHAHALDRQIGWLIVQKERVEQAGARGMPGASELLDRVTSTISYAYGLLCWIVTSEGPALPYEPRIGRDPELPQYIKDLHPMDVAQIAGAANEHHARLAALQILLDGHTVHEGGRRPSWSQFIGSLAVELKTDSVHISRFKSLASLLAMVQLNADAQRPDDDDKAAAAKNPAAGTLA